VDSFSNLVDEEAASVDFLLDDCPATFGSVPLEADSCDSPNTEIAPVVMSKAAMIVNFK
jgi:hypothetical protein